MSILDFVTLSQAAEALGYRNSSYLRRLCNTGQLPQAIKRGKTWFIPKAWVKEQQKVGESGQGARGKLRK